MAQQLLRRLLICTILCFLLAVSFRLVNSQEIENNYVSWNPDGSVLAVGFLDEVRIIDAKTLEVLNTFHVNYRLYTAPVWSPDGKQIAFGNETNVEIWEQVWDSRTAKQIAILAHDDPGLGAISAMAWSPDGKKMVSANGYYIKVWDTISWKELTTLEGFWEIQRFIAWSPSGDRFASGEIAGGLGIIETDAYHEIIGMLLAENYNRYSMIIWPSIRSMVWSPDGKFLIIGVGDGTLRIFDTTPTERQLRSERGENSIIQLWEHEKDIVSVAWRPGSSSEFATGSDDGTIKIWDFETRKVITTIEFEVPGIFFSIAWSPDGTMLAYGTPDRSVKFIEVPAFDDSSDVPKAGV